MFGALAWPILLTTGLVFALMMLALRVSGMGIGMVLVLPLLLLVGLLITTLLVKKTRNWLTGEEGQIDKTSERSRGPILLIIIVVVVITLLMVSA